MSKLEKIHNRIQPALTHLPEIANILIVDDQRFDRIRLTRLCSSLEFETVISEADSLESMGTMLQTGKYDLILLDYNLTDGTGLQAIEAIRMDPKNRNVATIMVTGDGQNEIAVEALKRGCSDYITKDDLSPESLRRAAINALQKSSLTTSVETREEKRRQMESVLSRFSRECAQEIKPVVSRMMRQLRDLRESDGQSHETTAEMVLRIEHSCMRLWEFLDDLDSYRGSDLARESFPVETTMEALGLKPQVQAADPAGQARPEAPPERIVPKAAPPQGKPSARRPSLFGRRPT